MTQATNRPATIRMWPSKTLVDPFDMAPSDVRLTDIAHSLARICRYTGAVEGFLSVAEHSITVARMLQADGEPIEIVRTGLMHDASEAYLGDISGPLKRLSAFDAYREAEHTVEDTIAAKYGLPFPYPPQVKLADTRSLNLEMKGDPRNKIAPLRERTMANTPPIDAIEAEFLAFAAELGLSDSSRTKRPAKPARARAKTPARAKKSARRATAGR